MIDTHCHILPGIDDGPRTLGESIQLCRIAAANGTTHAVATPHIHPGRWENDRANIEHHYQTLKSVLADLNIQLQLGFAGEVRLTDEIMNQVETEQIPYYGRVDGHSIMLLELPHGHIVPGSEKLIRWLLDHGIRPMIAHPERNKSVMKDFARVLPFVEAGCWIQITASSVTGDFGQRALETSRQMLERNIVTVIASDGHNVDSRPPILERAYQKVLDDYGIEKARRLTLEMPSLITRDQFSFHGTNTVSPDEYR